MKNKKFLIIPLILLIVSSIILIGISTWIIGEDKIVKPQNVGEDVVKHYLELAQNSQATYNKHVQLPHSQKLDESELTFYYKSVNDSNYIECTNEVGPINAGTYNIKVKYQKNNSEIIEIELSNNFIIAPKTLNVQWGQRTFVYDGNPHIPPATIDGVITGDICNLTVTGEQVEIGTYTANAQIDNSNYQLDSSTIDFKIESTMQQLSIEVVDNQSVTYNGTEQVPTLIVKAGEEVISDATLSYQYKDLRVADSQFVSGQPKNVTMYEVEITANKEGYKGVSETVIFTINKKLLTVEFGKVSITNATIESANRVIEYDDDINVAISNITISGIVENETTTDAGITYVYSVNNGSQSFSSDPTVELSVLFTDALNVGSCNSSIVVNCDSNSNYYIDSNNNSINSNFSIRRLRVYVNEIILEQKVTDTRLWTEAQTYLKTNVEFKRYLSNEKYTVPTASVSCIGLQDGQFKYGAPSENSTLDNKIKFTDDDGENRTIDTNAAKYLVGSTYYAYYSVQEPYQIVNKDDGGVINRTNKLVYKYKTVYTNNDYYTIEDALNLSSTSDMFIWGDATDGLSYGLTTFTSIQSMYNNSEYTVNNRKIYAPYTLNSATLKDTNGTGSNVFSCLLIPTGIIVNLNGSSVLAACSSIANGSQGGTATVQRGVIYNNGTINTNDNTIVYAYGYIKGIGKLNLNDNSKAYDVFRTLNWCGGTAATNSNMSSGPLLNKTFLVVPFTEYTLHNISCESRISSQVEYYGYFKTTVGGNNADAEVIILGNLTSKSCVFKPTSNSENNYIIKKAKGSLNEPNDYNALFSITGSNQVKGQRDIIDIYGSYTDNSISLSVPVSIGTGHLSTSTSLLLPVSYMHITVKNGSSLSLSSSDFMFMPGSSLTIEENATCTVGKDVDLNIAPISVITTTYMKNCVDKIDAKLIVNGTLNVEGSIGGFIGSTSDSGKLNILGTTSSYYDLYYTPSDPYRVKGSILASASILKGPTTAETSNITNGNYISQKIDTNEYAWGQSEGKIVYVLNNGSSNYDGNMNPLEGGFFIENPEINNPTKEHYIFDGWYTNESYETLAFPCTLYSSIMVYAKWIPIDYELKYDISFDGCSQQTVTNSNSTEYNADSVIVLTSPICDDYIFDGWYSDANFTNKVSVLSGSSILNEISSPYTYTLYGRFYPTGTETYTITYVNNHKEVSSTTSDTEEIVSINLGSYSAPDLSMKNNSTTVEWYFDGWYIDESYTMKLTDPNTQITSDITLYAHWLNKTVVVFNFVGSAGLEDLIQNANRYVSPGQNITIPDIESMLSTLSSTQLENLIGIGRCLTEFYCLGGELNKSFVKKGSTYVFTNIFGETINLWPAMKECEITVQFAGEQPANTSGTVTIANGVINDTDRIYSSTKGTTQTVNGPDTITIPVHYGDSFNCSAGTNTKVDPSSGTVSDVTNIVFTYTSGGCFAKGTNILLSDGTYKKIEDISVGDKILTFNHELGVVEEQFVTFIPYHSLDSYKVLELEFDNGKHVKVLYAHGFMNAQTRKYEEISYDNVSSMIGNDYIFLNESNNLTISKLKSYKIYEEITECYSLCTSYNLNHFIEGALCISDDIQGLYNYFELDQNYRYDTDLMARDIEKYGLLSYDEVSYFMSKEIYDLFNVKYLSVAIGKGLITIEIMEEYIEKFA